QGYKQLFLHARSITLPMDAKLFSVSAELPDSWQSLLADSGAAAAEQQDELKVGHKGERKSERKSERKAERNENAK
ncbi:MAG: hypothetical protein HKO71_02155, partial [Pseudomonadales bacterium]|nr:hypothetical protein [Pseudomonadales bacterium]